jgi:hypothetical protein
MKSIIAVITLTLFLTACGGGGGGESNTPTPNTPAPTPNANPAGLYTGQAATGGRFTVLATTDKLYVVTYDIANPGFPANIGVGEFTVAGNTLTADDLIYFNYQDGYLTADITATINQGSSLNGTLTIGTTDVSFTSSFDSTFNRTAALSEISGRSTGITASNIGFESAILNIDSNGNASGRSYAGCEVTGSFTPNGTGNFYDNQFSVTNCGELSGQSTSGVSLYDEDTNTFYVISVNNDTSAGIIYWGDVVRTINTEDFTAAPRSNAAKGEGIWYGSTPDNRTLWSLITDEGEGYMLYSARDNLQLAGIAYGYFENTADGFDSVFARDFNLEGFGILDLDVSAEVNLDSTTITGSLDYSNSSGTFSLSYDPIYEQTANIQDITGTYDGTSFISVGNENATVTITSNGLFTGVGSSGCEVQGVVQPRARGNFFDMSVTFTNNSCAYPNELFSGILFYSQATNTLYTAAPSPGLTDGVLFLGSKR